MISIIVRFSTLRGKAVSCALTVTTASNATANIAVPTTVAELSDASNYALASSLNNYRLIDDSYTKKEVDDENYMTFDELFKYYYPENNRNYQWPEIKLQKFKIIMI